MGNIVTIMDIMVYQVGANGLPTLFGHLRQHGYRTAAIGKFIAQNIGSKMTVMFF